MKFRIVQRQSCYNIQRRLLGLFWVQYYEVKLDVSNITVQYNGTVQVDYQTLELAKQALESIKLTVKSYKGHKIRYSSLSNLFVDLTDTYDVDYGNWVHHEVLTYIDNYAKTFEELCKKIDAKIKTEHAKKHKYDFVKVCD